MEIQYHPAPYPFIWNVSYSQGHEVLNKGHQNMFREVNDLWQTRDLKVAVEQLEKVRADFAALFAVEEKMMTQLLERQEQLKRSVIASKASSRRNRKLLDEGDESRTEDAAVPGAAVPGATVPGATEPVTSQDKIPRTLGGKVAFNDTHDQSPATSSASSSSLSTLGSDITPQRDRHYFYHSDNGEIIDLSTQALTVQRIQTHSTKHKLFLEDLEGIQRRLQFLLSGTAPKYVNDADFQGKREIQFISNWYIYHILSDDNSILYSFRLCQLLSGNREPGIVGIQYCNTRPKTNYRSLLETMSGVDLLSDDELNQLRNNKGFLIVRDWMAHLQQNFVVSICLIRPPSIQGSDFKIILSNVSWVEFSKVKPWFGCQKGYTQFFSAKNNLEITSILHDLKDANLPDGSYGIHKSQFIKGDSKDERKKKA
ncbi:hypothetical protein GNI_041270 [Gregarina niphandrodes]|uniref:Uncharacterized protein n=1 Tax=Gregarina niphandrodes TaxID=110365 RepID=A0A023BA89_GRENI|nr:hypothetical protein GNI_041270 [Gregarina niphandrodes]EZG77898.1 hypothetical protein GNI_041270 [Gregarina niphandrodes]|eukprot:XP_011129475.1 hypothetical protein GNI_041270 [Gregarina niphandrodes]